MNYGRNISPEELEEAERYLDNRMTAGEAEAFAARMERDEMLRQKVHELKLTILGIREEVLGHRLKEYHKEVLSPAGKSNTSRTFFGRWALAASLIMLISVSGVWLTEKFDKAGSLYSKYYQPDPGLMTLMSTGNMDYDFEKAMVEYKNGEYEKALRAWTELLKAKTGNDTLLYFSGAAAQAEGNEDAAINFLIPVARKQNSIFKNEAYWYLGLCYLKNGDKEKALKYIEQSEQPHSRELAEELRRD